MNESLDLSGLKSGQFAIVINEVSTGIVLNTETIERCTNGKCDFAVADSHNEAIAVAQTFISKSADIEAMIFDASGKFIEHVCSSTLDG